jgi:benzil reductase ((S)-benzoin forming)
MFMQKTVLITANSSGLGLALSQAYLSASWQVYGLSRRGYPGTDDHLHDIRCDLQITQSIAAALSKLLAGLKQLDLVYLNAGIIGDVKNIADVSVENLEAVMNVNVWANKLVLDYLLGSDMQIKQVIGISSGAALTACDAWAANSLAKAAFNKLLEFYANEYKDTHFCSLAPGLVDSAMQDYLADETGVALADFPPVKKTREAKGTGDMPSADVTANSIINTAARLRQLPSGTFADISKL